MNKSEFLWHRLHRMELNRVTENECYKSNAAMFETTCANYNSFKCILECQDYK
jgi:hypothetical protein